MNAITDMSTLEQVKAAEAAAMETRVTAIKAHFEQSGQNLVDVNPVNFNFKSVETETDKIDEKTGKKVIVKTKRPTLVLPLPVPSVEGLLAIISAGGKGLELLKEAAQDVIISRSRELINDDDKEALTPDNFPYEQLGWDTIANLPKAERRGGGISADVWDAFAKDYKEVMVKVGVSEKGAENQAKVLLAKLNPIKDRKATISKLKGKLGVYLGAKEGSNDIEQYLPCVEFLMDKADKLLAMTEDEMSKNLDLED